MPRTECLPGLVPAGIAGIGAEHKQQPEGRGGEAEDRGRKRHPLQPPLGLPPQGLTDDGNQPNRENAAAELARLPELRCCEMLEVFCQGIP